MLKWINKKRNRKGFTLVELVVVIAILGILAGIAVPRLSRSRLSAAISAHNANVRALESAATMAIVDAEPTVGHKWTGSEKEDDNEGSGLAYMQEWPKINGQLKGVKFDFENGDSEIIDTDENYEVEFHGDGTFTVTPGKIIKATED